MEKKVHPRHGKAGSESPCATLRSVALNDQNSELNLRLEGEKQFCVLFEHQLQRFKAIFVRHVVGPCTVTSNGSFVLLASLSLRFGLPSDGPRLTVL